jgi:hypothetical protein
MDTDVLRQYSRHEKTDTLTIVFGGLDPGIELPPFGSLVWPYFCGNTCHFFIVITCLDSPHLYLLVQSFSRHSVEIQLYSTRTFFSYGTANELGTFMDCMGSQRTLEKRLSSSGKKSELSVFDKLFVLGVQWGDSLQYCTAIFLKQITCLLLRPR